MEDKRVYQALMAMTEVEAAALDFLARLSDARQVMREAIERGDST